MATRRAGDATDAVAVALRLAFAVPRPEDSATSWDLAFAAAARELLAPLAWSRSGAFIRRHADDATTSAWRRAAIAAQMRGHAQLDRLTGVLDAFASARVDAVVLKGLPLGERLYGDAFARCPADVDLFVPTPERERAATALRSLGWHRTGGGAPWHEAWSVRDDGSLFHLELHSSLVSDHLAHLPVPPPAAEECALAGVVVSAHAGPFLAPYLAAHLATHQMPPLLWLVDFATLWDSLAPVDRAAAETAAARARLARYLAWARGRASLAQRAAAGDAGALRALGVGREGRHDIHSIWRHLALAASVADAAHVASAFVVPRPLRGDVRAMWRYTAARVRTRLSSLRGASRRYAVAAGAGDDGTEWRGPGGPRALRLGRADMVSLTEDVLGAGGSLRVRAHGGSMVPTIPRGALVHIGPVPPRGIAIGDVVLALTADGEPVLHRAVAVSGDRVTMRGDAALADDPPVPLARVIGVATHVEHGSAPRALGRRPSRSLMVSALKFRRRIARAVRRVE